MSWLRQSFVEALAEVSPEARCRQWCQRQAGCRWSRFAAVGKAAEAMALGLESVWPDLPGLVIVPEVLQPRPRWEVVVSTHPQLSPASLEAGRRLMDWLQICEPVLLLVSGGASALVEVLAPGVQPGQAFEQWQELYRGGHSIVDMNQRRARLSAIKGGQLLDRLAPGSQTLVWCDVLQGAAWVGSGMTWRSPQPAAHGFEVLADGRDLRGAMAGRLRERGYRVRMLDHFLGSLEQSVTRLRRWRPGPREVLLACSEMTVRVVGEGRGGRCQALVLELLEHVRKRRYHVLAAASDGCDGPTPYAGAEADPGTVVRARRRGLIPESFRRRQASSEFFERLGEAWLGGPTGNNLNDLVALARWQAPPEDA